MKRHTHKEIKQVGAFILDKSGSMENLRDAAISGFNEFLSQMKQNKVEVLFNLSLFDTKSIDRPYSMTPLSEVKELNRETYKPNAWTPLYDAVVEELERLEKQVEEIKDDSAISVVIMTDGHENASKNHNQKCLRDLIQRLEKKGNWTFAYMGANQDSYTVASGIGISRGSTMDWNATPQGTLGAFASLAQNSVANINQMRAMHDAGAPTASLHNQNFFSNGGDKK